MDMKDSRSEGLYGLFINMSVPMWALLSLPFFSVGYHPQNNRIRYIHLKMR
jgi:hypothetical protein